jgi:hypothetical protein
MSSSALEGLLDGLWAIHPSRLTALGNERYRRRPKRHIAFDASGWRLFETAFRRRFGSCGMSQGVWSVVTVDAGVLLVLTVNTCRHPGAYRAALGSNYGYGGGALVVHGAPAPTGKGKAVEGATGRQRCTSCPSKYRIRASSWPCPATDGPPPCSDGSESITSIAAFARVVRRGG